MTRDVLPFGTPYVKRPDRAVLLRVFIPHVLVSVVLAAVAMFVPKKLTDSAQKRGNKSIIEVKRREQV